jgi:hypothetical protein
LREEEVTLTLISLSLSSLSPLSLLHTSSPHILSHREREREREMELQGKSLLVSVRDDENNERSASKLRDQLDASAQEHLNVIKEKYVVTFYATFFLF